MQPNIKTSLTVLLFSFSFLIACNKNSVDTDPAPTNTNISATLMSGNWAITSYTQRTENKTNQFAGAVFTFSDKGVVTATLNGTTSTGTWIYSPSTVGYYGSAPSIDSIALNLGNSSPMNRLNRTWNITSSTNTTLLLVNPEPADDEHIQFTKQ